MKDSINPYSPPLSTVESTAKPDRVLSKCDVFAFAAWPVVFALNLFVPILFGRDLTREHGKAGVLMGCTLLLFAGWILCYLRPNWARRLICGSLVVALTQLYPIAHIIVGSIALSITTHFGLAIEMSDVQSEQISNELGGFVITVLVAGFFIGCAGSLGWFFALFLPSHWFDTELKSQRAGKIY